MTSHNNNSNHSIQQDDPTGVFSVFKQDTNRGAPFYCRWSTEEDKLLMEAVKKYGPHKWSLIAQHVPDRTPVQCSTRWLGALNPNVHKGKWSPEEDVALTEAVEKYSHKSVLPWNRIAQNIPNRTGIQCQARWTEALDPDVRKGRWNKQEDDMLREAVARYGCCWIRVSSMIFGRTQRQCRTRFNQIKSRKERLSSKSGTVKQSTEESSNYNEIDDDRMIKLETMQDIETTSRSRPSRSLSSSSSSSSVETLSTTSPSVEFISLTSPNSLASPTLSLEDRFLSSPPISPMELSHHHYQELQWMKMNLPRSITVAVNPCETDYFCLSPPTPLDEKAILPAENDDDHAVHPLDQQVITTASSHQQQPQQQQQPSFFTPCEFFRFNPELPTSLMLPDSELMLNDILSHQFTSSVL